MICRRIAGPLVGQESRLRMMLSIALEDNHAGGVNVMLTQVLHNQGD